MANEMIYTRRMLALSRALERLSSRDVERVLSVMHPGKGYTSDLSERYEIWRRLLKFSESAEKATSLPPPPDEAEK